MILTVLSAEEAPRPPVAKVIPRKITMHGETRVDNYFWLREKENPEVIAYLEAENAYYRAMMKPAESLREQLFQEIVGRIKQTDLSVPTREDDFYYYSRTVEGRNYPILCRKRGSLEAPEEVMLDLNQLAEGQKYFRLGISEVSPDHRLLAYSVDNAGDEVYTIQVKDLATGKLLPDRIPNTYYTFAWAADNRTFFYTTLDSAKRPYRAWRHTLGTTGADKLVYEEKDEKFYLRLSKSRSKQYLFINLASFTTSETRYLPAGEPNGSFRPIEPRRQDIEYDVEHHGEVFYIRTNDGAKDFRLVEAPVKDPGRGNWREVIPHRPKVYLEGVEAFRDHLVLMERADAQVRLRVRDLKTGESHYVDAPETVYSLFPASNPEFNTTRFRFNYSSLITPPSVFEYDMAARRRTLLKQQEVLGGYDPAKYETERIFATAPDGQRVPVSLVYRKGLKKDGSNPALLYGYGSYGSSANPAFSSERLSLLDRGFVYAIGHIRGGSDLGRTWHDGGKMLHKKNTFTDFIACAEALIGQGYTSKERLAIMGGSAGGLLMGAVVNLRPDLFKAVLAMVPFVDVLNTATDPSLPLTVIEYEEWGNSNIRKYFDYIKSYSPYDNVRRRQYPHMLITAGLNDPRVSYWEPAKWTAKLRTMKAGDNLLLLRTNMASGHGGASGRYDRWKEIAEDYSFLLHVLGVK
ncbi:MAG: S9 family peptidase [Bryobacterales bacterium]|nr:S9 family peptidase [Bryobacterales bacterium]